ncbi:MAG: hypothetical protein V4564_06450 [Pseudomonadota bacterium]
MRPHRDIDAVDLVQRQRIDRPAQMMLADSVRQRRAEALRTQRNTPRL